LRNRLARSIRPRGGRHDGGTDDERRVSGKFMSDSDNKEKPKLGARVPLGLKRTVETGKVKQSFSHGRSNTVVVEVKRRRILGKPGEADAPVVEDSAPAPAPVRTPAAPPPPPPAPV